jgi:AraC-like DNA-binding protein
MPCSYRTMMSRTKHVPIIHKALRIEKAKQLLAGTSKPVKEIAYELSFDSGLYFSKMFRQKTGLSPQLFASNRKLKAE